ncbi:hypothetical protein [Psychromonas sp. KJ10-2]|uniref:hypothetical protein n=1 Tax=Psychromonas sp. KJ10-2 TaxID=3391822 RepID=UPI0039B46E9A
MIKIRNLVHPKLNIKQWQIAPNQSWCVLGKNGSGKQYINQLFQGILDVQQADTLQLPKPDKIGLISFEQQQATYEITLDIEAPDFVDLEQAPTKARDFLPKDKWQDPLITEFGLAHRMDTGYLKLSTGKVGSY